MSRPLSLDERRSLAAFKGHRTRRDGKQEAARCPVCGMSMPNGALDHERRRHVDLYMRKAARRGELV